MTSRHRIETLYLSQEDLLRAGCLDMGMAMAAAERAMLAFRNDAMFRRAGEAGYGTRLSLQDDMIFQHAELKDWIRV